MARKAPGSNADLVLAALRAAGHPLSAYALLERLRPTGIAAPATVYRALDRLVAAGVLHKLASPAAYRVAADPASSDAGGRAVLTETRP